MPVSLQCDTRVATVMANLSGRFEWSGDTAIAARATEIMREKGWGWGRFLNDELFLVRRIVKVLRNCKVVDGDSIVTSLRRGWIRLLRDNLAPDPASHFGERLDDLTPWDGLGCQIEARGAKLSLAYGPAHINKWPVSGVVTVGDQMFLRFESRRGKTARDAAYYVRCVLWERIVRIHFSHSRPTPSTVIESRTNIRKWLQDDVVSTGNFEVGSKE